MLVLGRAQSTPEQLAAVQAASLDSPTVDEDISAARPVTKGQEQPHKSHNVSILGLSCNAAALAAIVAVLAGFFLLYQQARITTSVLFLSTVPTLL